MVCSVSRVLPWQGDGKEAMKGEMKLDGHSPQRLEVEEGDAGRCDLGEDSLIRGLTGNRERI